MGTIGLMENGNDVDTVNGGCLRAGLLICLSAALREG